MAMSDESFLPQIVGLFYATFDPKLGPTVLYQVPENLITSSSRSDEVRSRSVSRTRIEDETLQPNRGREVSRGRTFERTSTWSTTGSARSGGGGGGGGGGAGDHRSVSPTGPTLLDFGTISDYVIPKKSLYGRLVVALTTGGGGGGGGGMDDERAEYRIMGFPSLLTGEGGRYSRNEYMWNLCFVFHGSSSLEAFEPVVRKCGRILKSAELDSSYLSSPEPYHTPLSAVLEQLFEDLNSYSETSIPLDGFNSLELKLFPYFPNPPDCSDWHVPIPLVNLDAFRDDNWDITASRVAEHIDGVNHVKRIAELADADIALTRETLRHMLFYQVVMMIDIFQYSNMYTLKPSIARLGSDESVTSECAAYVTRPGYSRQPWPTLLRLYSHLVPGLTIHEWIEKYHTQALGIDPRRFVSFGIIKGFLRRVHRWPVLMEKSTLLSGDGEPRRRVEFDKVPRIESSLSTRSTKLDATARSGGESTFTLRSMESNQSLGVSPSRTPSTLTKSPSRRGHQPNFTNVKDSFPSVHSAGEASIPSKKSGGVMKTGAMKLKERQDKLMEEDLIGMLDGSHHTDEIQVRFGLSWKELDKVIRGSDRGAKDGVVVVYR